MDFPVSLLLLLLLLGMQALVDLTPILTPSLTLTLNQSTEHPSAAPPQTQPCILDPEIQ